MRRLLLLGAIALAIGGCGGTEGDSGSGEPAAEATAVASAVPAVASEPSDADPGPGSAEPTPEAATSEAAAEPAARDGVTVWVTRDAGAELLRAERVEAGLTAVQVVDLVAELETNYGGRYVDSIDGLSSDFDGQSDWFFLINGIEPDIGGAEIKVDDGDVVWWDYRDWSDSAAHPAAVVGAFPKPFHRGWKGAVRPVEVVAPARLSDLAAELQVFLGSVAPDDPAAEPHRFVLELLPEAEGAELTATMGSKNGSAVTFTLVGAEAAVRAAAAALIEHPDVVARRYTARFDERGQVLEP